MTARDVQHRISELLDERGWSQTHLAKIVGVPTSTITDIFKRDSYPTRTISRLQKCAGRKASQRRRY